MRKVRSLLSVLLVCCLLVNVVPVKSKAVGATAAVVGVSAAMVAASALIGLGVSPGEDPSVFNGIVQNAVDALSSAGYVAGGLINVFFLNDSFKYGIGLNFLEFLRNWLFESNFISSESFVSKDGILNPPPDWALTQASAAPYCLYLVYKRNGNLFNHLVYSFEAPIVLFSNSAGTSVGGYCAGVAFKYSAGEDVFDECAATSKQKPLFESGSSQIICEQHLGTLEKEFASDHDISLGVIADNSIDLSSGYTDWASNSVTVAGESEDDEDIVIFPVGLGPDYDNTISKPQEDVWSGTSEYEIEVEGDSEAGTGTETGLLSSILSAVKSIPSAFEGWFKDLIDLAGEIGEAIIGLPARIKDALTSLFQDVVNVGQAVVDAVLGIPQAIADVLTAIFVPDQAYVDAKVDAVYAQFPFIQSIIATGEELKGAVSGSSGPPVIYVDLGLAPSGDFGSQKVLLTDFSWYEPYKQRVDTLLSAALWALFGWKMFIRLPSIISGDAAAIVSIETQDFKLHREDRATVNGFVGLEKKGRGK